MPKRWQVRRRSGAGEPRVSKHVTWGDVSVIVHVGTYAAGDLISAAYTDDTILVRHYRTTVVCVAEGRATRPGAFAADDRNLVSMLKLT